MKIEIPNYKVVSWNTLYSSRHWSIRSRLAEEAHMLVGYSILGKKKMFTSVVDITVVASQKGRIIDSDNICAKILIDALKGRIIKDDTPRYVRRVTTESKKGKTDSVVITIVEAEGE